MDQKQAERLQQYQMNDALGKVQAVVHGLAQEGMPVEVTCTAMMVALTGAMAAGAVYGGASHDEAQKQLEAGCDTMRSYLAKMYTEIAEEKAKMDADRAEQPGWMNPENLVCTNSTAAQ